MPGCICTYSIAVAEIEKFLKDGRLNFYSISDVPVVAGTYVRLLEHDRDPEFVGGTVPRTALVEVESVKFERGAIQLLEVVALVR